MKRAILPALFLCATGAWAEDDEAVLGMHKVQVKSGKFCSKPSAVQGFIRAAGYGEEVNVVGVEKSFAQVVLKEGGLAYISRKALIVPGEFKPAPGNEEEMMKLKAQNYEAGRFDPATEKAYKEEKGPAMAGAYDDLDGLEQRPVYRSDPAKLLARLEEFRREGKLGEFSSVR